MTKLHDPLYNMNITTIKSNEVKDAKSAVTRIIADLVNSNGVLDIAHDPENQGREYFKVDWLDGVNVQKSVEELIAIVPNISDENIIELHRLLTHTEFGNIDTIRKNIIYRVAEIVGSTVVIS